MPPESVLRRYDGPPLAMATDYALTFADVPASYREWFLTDGVAFSDVTSRNLSPVSETLNPYTQHQNPSQSQPSTPQSSQSAHQPNTTTSSPPSPLLTRTSLWITKSDAKAYFGLTDPYFRVLDMSGREATGGGGRMVLGRGKYWVREVWEVVERHWGRGRADEGLERFVGETGRRRARVSDGDGERSPLEQLEPPSRWLRLL